MVFKNDNILVTDANGDWVSGGEWYDLVQPYLKNFGIVYCPDRKTNDPGDEKGYVPPQGGNYYLPGYGYDDGFISDQGYGLTYQDSTGFRPGRSLTSVDSPAQMAAFGDSYDNGSMSYAMDNILGTSDAPSTTAGLRHGGHFNTGFLDGHSKSIVMQVIAFNATGPASKGNPWIVTRPASQTDAMDWCYTPGAIADIPASKLKKYPMNASGETCAQAVADFFNPAYATVQ
jgi:prepilin-type processing-associated H-X9-DG protein